MAAILGMAAIGTWAIGTNQVSYVMTHGVSMNPVYYAGDLVFVAKSDSYEVGQIAAYHGADGQVEVLHRIIGGDGSTGFVFKGDNNQSTDSDKPTTEEIIGRAVLHIPRGGVWLKPFLSPTGLGMLGFLLVSSGAAAQNRRGIPRGRRKKRAEKGMSGGGGSWTIATAAFKAVRRLHPAFRVLAVVTGLFGIVGITLGFLGWIKPAAETVKNSARAGESITFLYTAKVPRSAAYDGSTVYSPDPIFRKLANAVDLQMTYQGEPGSIEFSARLSAENGWHTTVQLAQQNQFNSKRYTSTVQLDLNALEQRAKAAGEAIGADLGTINLVIKALVRHSDGTTFEAVLPLKLEPMQLALANGSGSLIVERSSEASDTSVQARRIGALGYDVLTATQARKYAFYLILVALIGAGIVAWKALGRLPLRTRAQIERRYPHLIVPVEPMASPPGKPIVTVDKFPALVKLAEKYGQMILTWRRPDGADDFVVRDEGILYRYRIEPEPEVAPVAARAGQGQDDGVHGGEAEGSALPATPGSDLSEAADVTESVETPVAADSATTAETAEAATPEVAPKKAPARKRATKTAAATDAPASAPARRSRAKAAPAAESSVDQPETVADAQTIEIPVYTATLDDSAVETTGQLEHPEPKLSAPEPAEPEAPEPTEPEAPEPAEPEAPETPQQPTAATTEPTDTSPEPEQTTTSADAGEVEAENGPDSGQLAEAAAPRTEPGDQDAATTQPADEAPQRPTRKRGGRRNTRRGKTAQPAHVADEATGQDARTPDGSVEGPGANSGTARREMEDLAERNLPLAQPEPGAVSGSEAAGAPNREPLYDFLPAAKRPSARPDVEEPDA